MNLGNTIAAEKSLEDSPIELHHKDNRDVPKNKNFLSRYANTIKLVTSITLLGIVVGYLAFNYDLSDVRSDLHQLSFVTIFVIFAVLFANALAATLRFKVIAADIGHCVSFRSAMATVSASTLAGAVFFQIAGQLMARGVIASRSGMPFAAVVIITAYERITAAIISALFALGGALFIFGHIYLDQSAGGAELIKIIAGLIAATSVGALLGYGRTAVRTVAPLLTRHFVRQCSAVIWLTLLVHIPMQAAYVLAAHNLSPQTSIANLIAASAIVMFATSVPISLAGWGMREMSAVVGLGVVGVSAHSAVITAVIVGIGSLLVVAVIAILALPDSINEKRREVTKFASTSIDYSRALSWFLPLAAATFVLFQIYIPVSSGLLNVNLADPIALVGGALFILRAIKQGRMPNWRAPYINIAVAIATFALSASLLIGSLRFGLTTWAWVNRFLGWFILLSYGATGALAVMADGKNALRIVLLTFVGATAAIAGIEVALVLLQEAGAQFASQFLGPGPIVGFAQNRNAFAFQLLMALSAAIVLVRGPALRIAILALLIFGFWLAGSRSGWIAAAFVIATSLYLGTLTAREIVFSITCAVCAAIMPFALSTLPGMTGIANHVVPNFVPEAASTHERWLTIAGGLDLFLSHPVFGAGLGAFRNETVLSTDGTPLIIHSTPVWLLAEMGIIGFAVFTVAALHVFFSEWRHARTDKTSALIVLCFLAFAVMSGPGDIFYQRTFWFVVGSALALTPVIINRGIRTAK